MANFQPLYPPPLRPGDRIAVTAPSSGVEPRHHARLDLVLGHLRTRGFAVEEGRCLRDERDDASAGADERAAELQALLCRDDIAAVIPPWGGERALELLDRLDWARLAAARPKWLLGYSDTSSLLLPLTLRLGWATAHGPCLMDLAPGQDDALTSRTLEVLATPAGGAVEQAASTLHQSQWGDFASDPGCTYRLDRPTRWWRVDGSDPAAPVQARGRLIGGCLDTLPPLAAGPHAPVRGFIERCSADGVLLYLENAELSPTGVLRALHALRWAGWLDGLAALLIGRSAAREPAGAQHLRHDDALRQTLGTLPCPVLAGLDIGHVPPQFTLVNGARAEIRFDGRGGTLRQHFA
ncbi:MAG: LD-carboxypeptidase [Rubrivivax sp.]|nr:LD-carboxypeptidase [Rubrivivax sp.]